MNAATTARTNNQSAAIALLAATSAKPAAQSPREDSFAEALSNVSQDGSKAEAGLFAARKQPAAQQPASRTQREAGTDTRNSKPEASEQVAAADATPEAVTEAASVEKSVEKPATKHKTAEPEARAEFTAGDLATESPLIPIEAAASPAPATTTESRPTKAARPPSGSGTVTTTQGSANLADAPPEAAATPASPAAETDESITPAATKRTPTDPLRLIQPNEQTPTAAQTIAAATANEPESANSDAPVAIRQPSSNKGNDASTPAPQSFGITQPGKSVPQSPIAGTGSPIGNAPPTSIGGNSTSNTSTSTIGAPRVDPSGIPPRLPGIRAAESPINLKLTARPLPSGEPTTTQTEADAAAAQIARGLGAAFRNKGGQLTLWLNPESLGKLRVQMTIDNGSISARFEATSEATKNLLNQNIDALRSALESRGLTANNIEVVSIADWSKPQDQPLDQGTRQQSNDGSFQQRGTNQQSSGQQFSHNHNARDNMPQNLGWLREPELNAQPAERAERVPHVNTTERLLTMSARLEIDALA